MSRFANLGRALKVYCGRKAPHLWSIARKVVKRNLWGKAEAQRAERGDCCHFSRRQDVPFNIVVVGEKRDRFDDFDPATPLSDSDKVTIRRWEALVEAEQERILEDLFWKLNNTFKYLSGARFSFKLEGIHFVDRKPQFPAQPRGFTLCVGSIFWSAGHYLRDGIVTSLPHFFLKENTINVGGIIHEMMHGLLGPAHPNLSFDPKAPKTVWNACDGVFHPSSRAEVELHIEEAEILGWPYLSPISCLTKI